MHILPSKLLAAVLSVAPLSVAPFALAQGAFAQGADPAADLILLADAGGDGDVAADEWAAFLESLAADADGALDARRVLARLCFRDGDGDGAFTADDARAAFAGGAASGLAGFFLIALADADGDGAASDAERAAFLGALPGADEVPLDVRAGWIADVEALPPPPDDDRGRLVPPVVLASLMPILDADANGVLTVADLNGLHRGADVNGDGAVTAAELASRQGPAFARWDVDAELKARPPLMPWQRSLEDALVLVERTGKPLLVCVNIDDENASEVLAWNRYRDPEFAALADGFVCVLASPDRREPREHDDRGRRLPDRRFGRLVNGEHIGIEPLLFERYFRGTRVAPRHVGVAPDGEILFDLYLLQDLSIIDAKLREHGRPDVPTAADPAGMDDAALLLSPDAGHRDELERRFVAADEPQRGQILAGALADYRPFQHPELVRLALRDPSEAIRLQAVLLMAARPDLLPLELVPEAFAVAQGWVAYPSLDGVSRIEDAKGERPADLLLTALRTAADRAGDDQRARDARFLARVISRIDAPSRHLDPARWQVLLAAEPPALRPDYAALDFDATLVQLEAVEGALGAHAEDAALLGRRADVLARLARIRMATGENPLYFLQDVERAADDAIARAPFDGRALGLKAWSLYHLNELPAAGTAATLALPHLARDAASPLAFEVLDVLATARTREIYDAIGGGAANEAWSDAALPDARAAYAALCAHPDATEAHWMRHLELLGTLRALPAQRAVVRAGLAALPASETLHSWLRFVELRDAGARALEAAYADLAPEDEALAATWTWFRGLATLVAAEHDVQCRDEVAARAAYARSGAAFTESAEREPAFASSAAHYSALALSGLAHLQAADGRIEDAARSIVDALRTAPASAAQPDGLGRSPIDTARELIAELERSGAAGLAGEIRAAAGVEL